MDPRDSIGRIATMSAGPVVQNSGPSDALHMDLLDDDGVTRVSSGKRLIERGIPGGRQGPRSDLARTVVATGPGDLHSIGRPKDNS